jgi:hypothetical protein
MGTEEWSKKKRKNKIMPGYHKTRQETDSDRGRGLGGGREKSPGGLGWRTAEMTIASVFTSLHGYLLPRNPTQGLETT